MKKKIPFAIVRFKQTGRNAERLCFVFEIRVHPRPSAAKTK
jgi:hypothetical protein